MNEKEFMALPDGTELSFRSGRNRLPRWIRGYDIVNDEGETMGTHDAGQAYLYELSPVRSARRGPQPINPGAWLASLTSAERKQVGVERGLFAYFPDALALVARHSVRSNEKHNPGQPVHWAREKSTDHGDCIARHHLAVSVDRDSLDDGQPHIVCRAWRALADLQIWAEEKMKKGEKL